MTGMFAAFAFARAGPTTVVSCASRIRTLAPCEISVSTSVSCCSVLRFASLSMYLPPASSTTFWMFGLSVAAQRGCWKLFQDTPTVQPAPDWPPPPAAVDGLALLEQAANTTAAVPTTAASLVICILTPPRTGIVQVTVAPQQVTS